jgi:hypothetical protein
MRSLLQNGVAGRRPTELSEDEKSTWLTSSKRPSLADTADWTTEDWKIYLTSCVPHTGPMMRLAPRELAAYDLGAEAYQAGKSLISCPWSEKDVPGASNLYPFFDRGWIDELAKDLRS